MFNIILYNLKVHISLILFNFFEYREECVVWVVAKVLWCIHLSLFFRLSIFTIPSITLLLFILLATLYFLIFDKSFECINSCCFMKCMYQCTEKHFLQTWIFISSKLVFLLQFRLPIIQTGNFSPLCSSACYLVRLCRSSHSLNSAAVFQDVFQTGMHQVNSLYNSESISSTSVYFFDSSLYKNMFVFI